MSTIHITVTAEEAEAVLNLASKGSTVGALAEVLETSEDHVVSLLEQVRQSNASEVITPKKRSSVPYLIAGIALACFALGMFVQSLLGAGRAPAPVAESLGITTPLPPSETAVMVEEAYPRGEAVRGMAAPAAAAR